MVGTVRPNKMVQIIRIYSKYVICPCFFNTRIKHEKACYTCDLQSFSGHRRSGLYNVVWTGPYNVIVPACASIAEKRPPRDAFLANEEAWYICDMH